MNRWLDHEGPVSFGPRGPDATAPDLWIAAARLAASIPAAESGSALLVFESDRFLFAAALLATWSKGLIALVPPDNRRATLTRLQGLPEVALILHDTESGLPHRVQDLLGEPGPMPDLDRFRDRLERVWQDGRPLLAVYGGGARSSSRRYALNGPMLDADIDRLAGRWPPGSRISSTVPVGHRFGLVAGVLLPLATGGAFIRGLGPGAAFGREADLLLTSPRDLARRARLAERGPPRVASAGSPLSPSDAAQLAEQLGSQLEDLFVTVAGGPLAARAAGEEGWRLLSGVSWEPMPAGSRFSFEHGSAHVADQFESSGGLLLERGRADDGPEPSPRSVEATVAGRPGVREAAAVRAPGGQVLVAAVGGELRDLEAATAGTRVEVRRVPALPLDGFGRVVQAGLLALFGRGPDGAARAETLGFGDASPDGDGFAVPVDVPTNYRWFDGHFDQYPVLPAAVQIQELVLPAAHRAGLEFGRPLRFERLKFSRRIRPGMALVVHLKSPGPGELRFEITAAEGVLSSGRAQFEVPG